MNYNAKPPLTSTAPSRPNKDSSKSSDSNGSSKPRKRPARPAPPSPAKKPRPPPPGHQGRDYDLNEIRSELKGLHTVKQEPEDATKTEEKEVTGQPETQPDKQAEDVYEFKEPEPFELELHDDKKKRTHRIFDDISPSKYTSTLSKSLSEEISEDPLRRPALRSPSLSPFRDFSSREVPGQSPEEDSKDAMFSMDDDSFPFEGSSGPIFEGFTPAKNQETYSKKSKVSKLRELIDDSPDSPADDEQSSDDSDEIMKEDVKPREKPRDLTPEPPAPPKSPETPKSPVVVKEEPKEPKVLVLEAQSPKEVTPTKHEIPKNTPPKPAETSIQLANVKDVPNIESITIIKLSDLSLPSIIKRSDIPLPSSPAPSPVVPLDIPLPSENPPKEMETKVKVEAKKEKVELEEKEKKAKKSELEDKEKKIKKAEAEEKEKRAKKLEQEEKEKRAKKLEQEEKERKAKKLEQEEKEKKKKLEQEEKEKKSKKLEQEEKERKAKKAEADEKAKLKEEKAKVKEEKPNVKEDKEKVQPEPVPSPKTPKKVELPASPLVDTEEDKSEPDSPARIDVLPDPPPGFLLHSEGPKIAEKLLKAINSAKRLSMSPPPATADAADRPKTPKKDALKVTKPDAKSSLSPVPENKTPLGKEMIKPQSRPGSAKKDLARKTPDAPDSIFGEPSKFTDAKRELSDIKKVRPKEASPPRLQSPLSVLERRKSVAELLAPQGKSNKVLSDTIQKLSSQINQTANISQIPLPPFPVESRSESSDSDDSDRR